MTDIAVSVEATSGEPTADPALDLSHLIEQSAIADAGAFGQLYDLASPRMFGLILRVIGNRALAEEVLQDVFLAIWTKASPFDLSKGAAFSWLLTIAHRRAVDCVRARRS